MAHVFEVAVRYERKVAPKDYESIAGFVELKATCTADENAEAVAADLLVQARDITLAGISNQLKGKTTETAERQITDSPEDRKDSGEELTPGQKAARTRAANKAAKEKAEAEKKDAPKVVEGAEDDDDANATLSVSALKTFIQDAVRTLSDGNNNTDIVNKAREIIAEHGDGAQASGSVPANLRGKVRDAIKRWVDGGDEEGSTEDALDSL